MIPIPGEVMFYKEQQLQIKGYTFNYIEFHILTNAMDKGSDSQTPHTFNLSPLGTAESRSQTYQNWYNFNRYVPNTKSN